MGRLNKGLIKKALLFYIQSLTNNPNKTVQDWMDLENARKEIEELNTKIDLKHGGMWLGVIRSWIQRKFINGDSVSWSSNEYLTPVRFFTVQELEALAQDIAETAVNEYKRSGG